MYAFSNYFQIPQAGIRSPVAGELQTQSIHSYYWASTPYGTNAYYLYFYPTSISPQYNSHHRAYGFSVRCFQNAPFRPFITTRRTTTANESITIPTVNSTSPYYNFTVDW